jgi:hypothetical protein
MMYETLILLLICDDLANNSVGLVVLEDSRCQKDQSWLDAGLGLGR